MACVIDEFTTESVNTEMESEEISQISSRKSNKILFPELHLNTKQIVVSLITNCCSEIILSMSSISGNTSSVIRPERTFGYLAFDSIVISVMNNCRLRVLLNPWSCGITSCLLWEAWQESNALPHIQVQADSESIYLEIGPEQIRNIQSAISDCQLILDKFKDNKSTNVPKKEETSGHKIVEQHYKDDLKAGAFQFTDGSADELPLPYQVNHCLQ